MENQNDLLFGLPAREIVGSSVMLSIVSYSMGFKIAAICFGLIPFWIFVLYLLRDAENGAVVEEPLGLPVREIVISSTVLCIATLVCGYTRAAVAFGFIPLEMFLYYKLRQFGFLT